MICSIKEPELENDSVMLLDFIECRSVDLSRQLFNSFVARTEDSVTAFEDHCDSQYQTLSIGSLWC